MQKIHAGHISTALAWYFNWRQSVMMPQWFIDGGIADLLFISRAGYATEIEIKTSLSDWNADQGKEKWKKPRPHITRFFYAVPESLMDRCPVWINPDFGLIAVSVGKTGYAKCRVVREARRFKAAKLPADELQRMYLACYHRFWRKELALRRDKNRP